MPNAFLDNDSKYIHLVETYKKIFDEKSKNENEDKNFNLKKESSCKIFDNILEALNWITNNKDDNLRNKTESLKGFSFEEKFDQSNKKSKINVVITGSLYLVGLSLKVLNYRID
jgi:hypothetical protein